VIPWPIWNAIENAKEERAGNKKAKTAATGL